MFFRPGDFVGDAAQLSNVHYRKNFELQPGYQFYPVSWEFEHGKRDSMGEYDAVFGNARNRKYYDSWPDELLR